MDKKGKGIENKPPLYVASCSFGKDSLATVLLALEHGEPLDRVVFSEVMFCHKRGISGENPEHIAWVYDVAIPKLEGMGVKVDVVRGKKDFMDIFYHVCTKGKRVGMMAGFPMQGKCKANSGIKIDAIRKYMKHLEEEHRVVQYIGIAVDEPERLKRLQPFEDRVSLLEKYGYTERMAMELCKRKGLLSPMYQSVARGGVFLLPKCKNIRVCPSSEESPRIVA